jgi:uncharacterized membrane protein
VNAPAVEPQAIASRRWDAIDVARGIAIAAMVVYHFSWDLSYLKLIETNIIVEPGWKWFARSIAGSFLILVGIGLALAHARGFRLRPFLRRLAKIGGAALAVTIATYFAFPESYIFFGILHCIALSSVLALFFLRAPWPLTLAAAVFCFAAPWLFTSPELDAPWLDWLGLGETEPFTNDYVPIFPWFGFVLAGLVIGNTLLHHGASMKPASRRSCDPLSRTLAWAGRRSLPIYLVHQPLLLAVLFGIAQVTGPNPAAEVRDFVGPCEASCVRTNGNAAICRSVCGCVAGRLRHEELWPRVMTGRETEADQSRVTETARACLREQP